MVWYLFILFHWFILVPMQHQTKYHLGDNVSLSWTAPDQLIHDQSWNPGTRSGRRILEASPCHGLLGPGGCLKCIPSRWMLVIICWFWYSPLMLASHLKWTWCAGVPPFFFCTTTSWFCGGWHPLSRQGQNAGKGPACWSSRGQWEGVLLFRSLVESTLPFISAPTKPLFLLRC